MTKLVSAGDDCTVIDLPTDDSSNATSLCAPKDAVDASLVVGKVREHYVACNDYDLVNTNSDANLTSCQETREEWLYGLTGCVGCGLVEEGLVRSVHACSGYVLPSTCTQAVISYIEALGVAFDEFDTHQDIRYSYGVSSPGESPVPGTLTPHILVRPCLCFATVLILATVLVRVPSPSPTGTNKPVSRLMLSHPKRQCSCVSVLRHTTCLCFAASRSLLLVVIYINCSRNDQICV